MTGRLELPTASMHLESLQTVNHDMSRRVQVLIRSLQDFVRAVAISRAENVSSLSSVQGRPQPTYCHVATLVD